MSSLPLQPLRRRNLRGDDSLGIARSPTVNARIVFAGRNKRRHGVHVGGEDNCWIRLLWRGREHIGTLALHGDDLDAVAELAQMLGKKNPDTAFVAGYGFNIDELAS